MKKTIFLKSVTTGIFGLALLSNCSGAMEKKESHKCSSSNKEMKESHSCSSKETKETHSCSSKEIKESHSCSSKKSK